MVVKNGECWFVVMVNLEIVMYVCIDKEFEVILG